MAISTYVMFGTDVVSCVYADHWNKSDDVDGPITGFVDAKQGAENTLATFRPGSKLLTWQSIATETSADARPTIVYPKHHEQALLKQIEPLPNALRSQLHALALPEPPDYVIEWQCFDGTFNEACELTDGYDSTIPTEHLIQSTLDLSLKTEHQLTGAQARQIKIIGMLINTLNHPLRVVDFGGAAGANYHVLPRELKERIESWTVVETPQVVQRASQAFRASESLHFVESLGEIARKPDYVLASSSLQYVPNAKRYLKDLQELDGHLICLDRTPMSSDESSHVYLQRVHREQGGYSYETSYPLECRPISAYANAFDNRYRRLQTIQLQDESLLDAERSAGYYCMLFERLS